MVIAYHMYIVQSATKEVAVKWLHCVVATVYFMHWSKHKIRVSFVWEANYKHFLACFIKWQNQIVLINTDAYI